MSEVTRWTYVNDSNVDCQYLDGDSHAPVGAEYVLASDMDSAVNAAIDETIAALKGYASSHEVIRRVDHLAELERVRVETLREARAAVMSVAPASCYAGCAHCLRKNRAYFTALSTLDGLIADTTKALNTSGAVNG